MSATIDDPCFSGLDPDLLMELKRKAHRLRDLVDSSLPLSGFIEGIRKLLASLGNNENREKRVFPGDPDYSRYALFMQLEMDYSTLPYTFNEPRIRARTLENVHYSEESKDILRFYREIEEGNKSSLC